MAKIVTQRGPKPVKRNKIILALRAKKQATSAELGVATAYMDTLLRGGIVAVAGKGDKSGKGRKPNVYKLTPRGNGKASALKRASA